MFCGSNMAVSLPKHHLCIWGHNDVEPLGIKWFISMMSLVMKSLSSTLNASHLSFFLGAFLIRR